MGSSEPLLLVCVVMPPLRDDCDCVSVSEVLVGV